MNVSIKAGLSDIQSRVRNDMDQQQREYYLVKTIQEKLGGSLTKKK